LDELEVDAATVIAEPIRTAAADGDPVTAWDLQHGPAMSHFIGTFAPITQPADRLTAAQALCRAHLHI
jgi:hypothetical protein